MLAKTNQKQLFDQNFKTLAVNEEIIQKISILCVNFVPSVATFLHYQSSKKFFRPTLVTKTFFFYKIFSVKEYPMCFIRIL